VLPNWRLYTGIGLLGVATASVIGASASLLSANDLHSSLETAAPSQSQDINDKIHARKVWATVGFTVAGVTAASGLLVLLWPNTNAPVDVHAGPGSAFLELRGSF
jgi:hypothetical protein